MSQTTNAGIVTAYGAAVRGGYEGTYDQFCADLAQLATVLAQLTNMSAVAETLAAGSSATASYEDGVLTLGIPRGDTGNGIQSISLISTVGLVKTYRITFTDEDHFDFELKDGNGIASATLNQDYTLTLTFNDGTTWTSTSIRGATGATPNLTIGTVNTGAAGSDAAATITGTPEDPVLNLTIPKGDPGEVPAAAIASTQASTTASKKILEGEYFWLSGILYIATAEIASGGTIVTSGSGANCKTAKVADDVSELKTALGEISENTIIQYSNFSEKKAISLLASVGETVSLIPTTVTDNAKYAVISCSSGDKFTVNGTSYSSYRLWGFLDSQDKLISKALNNASGNNLILTAPENAAKLVLNSFSDVNSYIGEILSSQTKSIDTNTQAIIKDTTGGQPIVYSDMELRQVVSLLASVGSVVDTTPSVQNSSCKYAVISCLAGQKFTVNGTSYSGYRLWAFLDSGKKLISKASNGATGNNTILTAPENAAYLVLNSFTDTESYYGEVAIAVANQILRNPKGYKKLLTIGDSLTNAAYNGANWQPYIVDSFGLEGYIKSGAIGLSVATVVESSIYSTVQALTADSDVNLVTFWGGTNDYTFDVVLGDFDEQLDTETRDTTTFYGALIGCVEKLMELYPAARIIMIGTTPRIYNVATGANYHNEKNSANLYLSDYVDAVKTVAEWFGLPFLDLLRCGGINELNINQYLYQQSKESGGQTVNYYLHISDVGMPYIGNRIAGFIRSIG